MCRINAFCAMHQNYTISFAINDLNFVRWLVFVCVQCLFVLICAVRNFIGNWFLYWFQVWWGFFRFSSAFQIHDECHQWPLLYGIRAHYNSIIITFQRWFCSGLFTTARFPATTSIRTFILHIYTYRERESDFLLECAICLARLGNTLRFDW